MKKTTTLLFILLALPVLCMRTAAAQENAQTVKTARQAVQTVKQDAPKIHTIKQVRTAEQEKRSYRQQNVKNAAAAHGK